MNHTTAELAGVAPIGEVLTPDWRTTLARLSTAHPPTIAIPVFNGGELVRRCLTSVLRHARGTRILIIDDASTDPATVTLLDDLSRHEGVELVRHPVNRGYTRTVNHALEIAGDDDVILLNSDTEVGPLWWQRLRWVAYSDDAIGTASAGSDNAGAMALPDAGAANEWPDWLSWDETSRAVGRDLTTWAQSAPTGHGFCMYIRRDLVDEIGAFDDAAFPRGYGEENDFSMRAAAAGRLNAWAPHVFVRHAKGGSFGSEREGLMRQARAVLDARHPTYTQMVRAWLAAPATTTVRETAAIIRQQLDATPRVLPRVLYVLHKSGGGTPATTRDLVGHLETDQESYVLEAVRGHQMVLSQYRDDEFVPIDSWRPASPFTVRDTWHEEYAAYFAGLLAEHGFETVHVRHLINQPIATVPEVCRLMGVRLVYSTHDFYTVCPTVHLLDEKQQFCGGVCTPGPGHCTLPVSFVENAPQPLKHGWVSSWQRSVATTFSAADHVIATTRSAADVLLARYPEQSDRIRLIEHGRDITRIERTRQGERMPGPLRIAAAANWDYHKGPEYLRALARALGDQVEWHVLGNRSEQLSDVAVPHGPYTRGNMTTFAKDVDPDFFGIFSIAAETYSHTLTEAWAMGVPVVVTDIGAPGDRVRAHGGGLLLPLDDISRAAETLRPYARDISRVTVDFPSTPTGSVRSPRTMAEDYRQLYLTEPRREPPLVGYVARGKLDRRPPTVDVRLLSRIQSAHQSSTIHFREAEARDLAEGTDTAWYHTVVVQRDAVPGGIVRGFLEAVKQRGARLVVELDDDLVSEGAIRRLVDGGYDQEDLLGLRALLRASDQVIVTNRVLADRMRDYADRITVVPNSLDPRIWCPQIPERPAPRREQVRLLYAGSLTHARDLAIIEELPGLLGEALARPVEIELLGITGDVVPRGMRRLEEPLGNYANFSRWMRQHRGRWNAALAPLEDTSFSAAKSDLKLLEYAMLRLPVIASDVGPYRDSPLATLVENTAAAWTDAAHGVLTNPTEAVRAAAEAHSLVLEERMLGRREIEEWNALVLGEPPVL